MIPASLIPDLAAAARASGHDPAAILAIVEVESGGRLLARVNGRDEPLIRFEGHYFDRRLTGIKRETARAAGLADPRAGRVKNPASQTTRHAMLKRAEAIDAKAARESCSWGIGQVMGAHWAWLGYPSVDALVEEARSGLAGQLRLMLAFIHKSGLSDALRKRDWTAFAKGYNGPGFAANAYHTKLAAACRRYAAMDLGGEHATSVSKPDALTQGSQGSAIESLQRRLSASGYPLTADGRFGPLTQKAIKAFQRDHGLGETGIADAATLSTLESVLPLGPGRKSLWQLASALIGLLARIRRLLS